MKCSQFISVIERRLQQGDYVVHGLPTEEALATEIGVSRTTVRRGLQQLMQRGVLSRKRHGRLEINGGNHLLSGALQLAFLAPAYSSPDIDRYRFAIERSLSKRRGSLRAVEFVHWDDAVIPKTLSSFDGIFLVPSSEEIPLQVIQRFSQASNLVALDTDLSGFGIPSVQLLPPVFVQTLAEHLFELGHRQIDCFNTQPHDDVIKNRIEHWLLWQKVRKVPGRLIDEAVQPYQDNLVQAYNTIKRMLAAGEFSATALVCLTAPAMVGVARALHEHGLRLGHDVSLCTLDGAALAKYQIPSWTAIQMPDPDAYLDVCLDWFAKRNEPWTGPLLIRPIHVPLFVGESTGPCVTKGCEGSVFRSEVDVT